ncbi:hypothetical protein E3N88_37643 [Mikania micrantha]|uniref:Uncharacterized protein n=1 Tax=Mikania micrantha TaxID=192012 RepID=A0A5N6LRN7_9ASTR|nr:hypothetical protein E3N88_37643 [Mikania micrantha]
MTQDDTSVALHIAAVVGDVGAEMRPEVRLMVVGAAMVERWEPLAPVPHWVPIIPPRKGYDAGKIPPLDTARIWAMPASFKLSRLAQGSTAAGTSEGWLE